MKLQKATQGTILCVYVKPNSKEFKIETENDYLMVFCREAPEKGRVNKELIKELSTLFKRRVDILSGFTSRRKRILVIDASAEWVDCILSSYSG
jgi:uncharacterized protein (TIGR00251 family)